MWEGLELVLWRVRGDLSKLNGAMGEIRAGAEFSTRSYWALVIQISWCFQSKSCYYLPGLETVMLYILCCAVWLRVR